MNIWIIQSGEAFPLSEGKKKMRSLFLTEELLKRGHKIVWWTSAFDHLEKEWVTKKTTRFKQSDNYEIIAIKALGYKKNVSLRRFVDHRIVAKRWAAMACKHEKPDCILISVPSHDLAYQAAKYAVRNSIPYVIDVRDPWPDIFLKGIPSFFHSLAKLFLSFDYYYLRYSLKNAVCVLSVTKNMHNWALKHSGRNRECNDKVFYTGCTKHHIDISPDGDTEESSFSNELEDKFVVTFIGTFSDFHNPTILVDIAERMEEKYPDIYFVIGGKGKQFDALSARAASLNNCNLPGWLNEKQIGDLLTVSNVGVVPTNFEIKDILPNKAYTYMSAGLPLLSTFEGDLKELIAAEKLGFNYERNNTEDCMDKLIELYENKEVYNQARENSSKCFDQRFNSDLIFKNYADHLEKVLSDCL